MKKRSILSVLLLSSLLFTSISCCQKLPEKELSDKEWGIYSDNWRLNPEQVTDKASKYGITPDRLNHIIDRGNALGPKGLRAKADELDAKAIELDEKVTLLENLNCDDYDVNELKAKANELKSKGSKSKAMELDVIVLRLRKLGYSDDVTNYICDEIGDLMFTAEKLKEIADEREQKQLK